MSILFCWLYSYTLGSLGSPSSPTLGRRVSMPVKPALWRQQVFSKSITHFKAFVLGIDLAECVIFCPGGPGGLCMTIWQAWRRVYSHPRDEQSRQCRA